MKYVIELDEKRFKDIQRIASIQIRRRSLTCEQIIANGIQLVQCKECDYWEKSKNSLQGRCCLLQMYPTGDWFCGNGKRKENKE